MPSTAGKLAGIFDLARTGGSLGQLLILLEELAIQRQLHGLDSAEVFLVGDARHLFEDSGAIDTPAPTASIAMLQTVARAMTGIADCHDLTTQPGAQARARLTASTLWPAPDDIRQGRHNYDSTRAIQDCHLRNGRIPRLSVRPALLERATRLVREKAAGALPVAVHLKHNPHIAGQSNADLDAWRALFIHAQRHPAHFFLIGDEATNAGFRDLPNVSIARDDGMAIDGYLALVQACPLFMGMMSGPANMALFGEKPYLIFKNPDHHAAEMALEIGDNDHYPFALGHQKVLRIWDTPDTLIDAFANATRCLTAP